MRKNDLTTHTERKVCYVIIRRITNNKISVSKIFIGRHSRVLRKRLSKIDNKMLKNVFFN